MMRRNASWALKLWSFAEFSPHLMPTRSASVRSAIGSQMTESSRLPVGKVVGPGDVLLDIPESGTLRLGPGVTTHDGAVVALKAGVLHQQPKTGQIWIQGKQKRYIPAEGEIVLGFVLERHAENFVVDINGPFPALLPQLSFEGATKRNRPNIKAGDVVYARVATTSRDMDPILTCVDAAGRANGLGHLKDGAIATVSTATARKLLSSPPAPVLEALGSALRFDIATGANGRVWVNAESASTVVMVVNTLTNSERLTDAQVRTYVARMVEQMATVG